MIGSQFYPSTSVSQCGTSQNTSSSYGVVASHPRGHHIHTVMTWQHDSHRDNIRQMASRALKKVCVLYHMVYFACLTCFSEISMLISLKTTNSSFESVIIISAMNTLSYLPWIRFHAFSSIVISKYSSTLPAFVSCFGDSVPECGRAAYGSSTANVIGFEWG